MKKIFTVFLAVVAVVFGTQALLAAVGDYKNNLLKIEITKLDENNYDIGLYTQKIYNEPVKIIKKTDTVYYFLLPETSNSITSVTPNDAIKNVLIKSYPYAGQDMENSYTKVAIITSKPVNLSTSLRTLDTSISPRLDPIRLARLDKVFERYSDRLAENNIPTPLAEFRKEPVVAKKPEPKKEAAEEKIASSTPVKKVQKPTAKAPVEKPVQIASKPKTQTTVNKQPAQTIQKAIQAITKPVIASKPAAKKPAVTAKAKTSQPKPVTVTSKPVQVETKKVQKQTVAMKPVQKVQPKPVSITSKPVQVETKKELPKQTVNNKTKQTALNSSQTETKLQEANNEAIKPAQKEDTNKKQVEEFEKQLATTEPIDAEFGKKVPVDNVEDAENNKNIEAEVVEPIQNIPQENIPAKNSNNGFMGLFGIFAILLVLYIFAKKHTANKKKLILEATSLKNSVNDTEEIKEFLKKRTAIKKEAEEPIQEPIQESVEEVQIQKAEAQTIQPEIQNQNTETSNNYIEEKPATSAASNAASAEDERIQAFNAYMENVQETPSNKEDAKTQTISDFTEDDAVIAQLYTPIESLSGGYASYIEENEIQPQEQLLQPYEAVEPAETNINGTKQENDDVATIVSSSKLTETRGLYLAKFEGATSLVGYIQDDIYVLYNFGDVNVQDTKIESSLAQENDTDSIYIVKTGGKKLMVKSTPYDMSLEMVM